MVRQHVRQALGRGERHRGPIVDHINQADIPARAAAEVAAQSGHDLFWFLAPPAQYEDQVVDHADIVQEVTKKRGKMADVAQQSTYNPRTKKYFAFSDTYAPDPVNWRTDHWGEAGHPADDLGQRAPGGAAAARDAGTRSGSACRTRSTRTCS